MKDIGFVVFIIFLWAVVAPESVGRWANKVIAGFSISLPEESSK